jgi:hypothetical protein
VSEDLPTGPPSTADASGVLAAKICGWCWQPIPAGKRRDAKTCSARCRRAANRFRVEPAPRVRAAGAPLVVAYADPPYPRLARRYYGTEEVDHAALVQRLVDEFPDGWALSTSARALQEVLALCPRGVRVCSWHRGAVRKGPATQARTAWEPLLVWGGRRSSLAPGEVLDDTLVHAMNGGRRSHPGALPGMKPPQFSRWLFRLLGLARGDTFVDLFPGSGAVTRAWQLYSRELPDPATERGELGDPNTGTSPDVLLRPATPRPARRSRS